jgi:hypothetical protein
MKIMSDPRYPIGKFQYVPFSSDAERLSAIAELRNLPQQLKTALEALGAEGLDTPYREGGWTVRQLVHHIADSHMNAFARFKLGLTETRPVIKPYDENAWVMLPDASLPVEPSLQILEGVHQRLTVCLELTPTEAFGREVVHPDNGVMTLDKVLQMYAWHGRHHVAHIENAPR